MRRRATVLLPLVLLGCSSSAELVEAGAPDVFTPPPPAMEAGVDAGPDVIDAGADVIDATDEFGAPRPHMPLLEYLGGAILSSVSIVTVTYASDDANVVARMQKLGDTITQTPWWAASTSEYCVLPANTPCIGQGSSGGHVVLNEAAPQSLTDTFDGKGTLPQWIQAHVDSGDFPAPTSQTLYSIFFPSGTVIKNGGNTQSCSSYGAYHTSTSLTPKGGGAPVETAYAIMPRCAGEPFLAIATSHEFIEAATDAHPTKDRGWVMQDPAFPLLGDETGDLCDHPWGGVFETTTESTFTVQRGWSNKQALAGHDPCAPANKNEVWFAAGPSQQELTLGVGETATLDVVGYADGMIADWPISAIDASGASALTLKLDKGTANDGTIAKLTVTLNALPQRGFAPFSIVSKSSGREMHWGASVRPK